MITISKDKKGLYYFHVTAKNGQILVHSEGYTRKENAKKAIGNLYVAIKNIWLPDENFELKFNDSIIIDKTNGK